ncbi:MAG: cation transporter, partial [Proteobacteria bacterium]|nr:cation transporter [Pseudomonadota bacterium]NIS68654.1 cation transporter [Pseudomonadota bacterium]
VAFILMIFSAIFKEWMARFALAVSKMIRSDMLKADAWHHRSDAAASAFVAISLAAAAFGYSRVDSVFGFCVAGLI